MLKRINDFLAGWIMTAVGGVLLLASFILPRVGVVWGEYLAWGCVVICGLPLLYLALWRIVYNKGISKISSALLISVAMIAALLIGDLFAAGEVAFIMEIGALLEDMTTERAKKGLKNLLTLTPATGRVVRNGKELTVPAEEIRIGDTVRILPGEIIPVDGTILTGETSVDQSVMTGESLPVDKGAGDEVFCGTINRFGSADITATQVGKDTSLQKLIRTVQNADQNQAHTQRIADRWASWLVPVALLIAVAAYLITGDIVRGVTVLVVFCPCALILATPTAIMAAIGQATKHGVIVKSGQALETMGKIRTVALDKTGTLTYGRPEVCDVVPAAGMDGKELLILAASAESRSEHPLGKAITEKGRKEGALRPIADFQMFAGKGIFARIDGTGYYFGKEAFFAERGIAGNKDLSFALDRLRDEGKAVILAANEKQVLGVIALADSLRPDAAQTVRRLEKDGTRVVLLTGDNRKTAEYFANQAEITQIQADLLPEDKVNCVTKLKESGAVCMVGDGVNDAPALKTADVGVAMGAMGSDISVEAADVALMTDDLSKIHYLKWLADSTGKTIRGAIALSMCINAVAVTLSALGLLNPTAGALVHNAGSCFVVLLAALLYDRKYKG